MADSAATSVWPVIGPIVLIALCCGLPVLLLLFRGQRRGPPDQR